MKSRHWLRLLLAAFVWAAFLAAPGLPLPAGDRLGADGSAAAQESIDIDTFYDELEPYGQWVWHPRFGYVWLPETVSENWRPYAVGRWTYTDEYGWYWDSYEPFAWAVYHYGRWGYDPDYGWFWVPGDTWAPAWVQWRYSDDYVGWAPIGPGRPGYAYGVPVNYDPPIAESWVFVQPRYMTSRAISHYALPIGGLSVAFFGATHVYRPIYRGGIVYNYGMPRDRVVQITRRPIYVQKVYKTNNWKGGRFDRDERNKGIKIYAPHFSKDGRPNRGPKKFADNPNDFRPKAKLRDTYKGDVPKGWGPSARGVKSIAKEDPDAFKKKHGFDGRDFGDRGRDRDNDRDRDKGQASRESDRGGKGDTGALKGTLDQGTPNNKVGATDSDRDDRGKDRDKNKQKGLGGPGGPNQFKQGNREDDQGGAQGKKKDFGAPGGPGGPGGINQFKQGNRDNDNQGGGQGKKKDFGAPGGPGGPNRFKQGNRDQDYQGGGAQRKQKGFGEGGPGGPGSPGGPGDPNRFKQGGQGGGQGGQDGQRAQGNQGGGGGGGGGNKCQKHPEKPECQGRD
jgi:hypothetical protein